MSWSYVWPIALAVALIIVGGLLYHEAITVNKVIGGGHLPVGLYLIN